MRIVSWNMAYWKPGGFNAVANRQRQWSLLLALGPDLALLQECRPGDFEAFAPAWALEDYQILGAIPKGWTACSAVLARRTLEAEPIEPDDTAAFRYFSGYLARARVRLPGAGPTQVASVHAIAAEVDNPVVTDADHAEMKRTSADKAWHCDVAAFSLQDWIRGPFVVGGDWNTARLFDETYPDKWPNAGREFFELLASWGWDESLRRFHPDEIRTYLDPASGPYELDHLFTDTGLGARLTSCEVLTLPALAGLSDHAAVIADFAD